MRAVTKSILAEWRADRGRRASARLAGEHSAVANEPLLCAVDRRGLSAELVPPARLDRVVRSGDAVPARVDVRRSLDAIEDGTWELHRVERRGIRALNPTPSLIACHDKLEGNLVGVREVGEACQ